ncbi:MAG: hypothetical protein QM673_01920 [Gordonia sp. (in: high G+C Gram-positive bacteria)]
MPKFSITIGSPVSHPALWREYLSGAEKAYRRYGCSSALEYDRVVDGEGTLFFFAITDFDGKVCGGLRVQPWLTAAAQSHALEEWSGEPGQVHLVNAIEERLAEGLVEVKTAWSDERSPIARDVVGQLSRLGLVIVELCDVRYMMATAADHVLRLWNSGGGRVDARIPATPFPDDRYRTQLMWWDRQKLQSLTTAATWERMRADADLLHGAVSPDTDAIRWP